MNAGPISTRLERALRLAASWHAGQTRKGSAVPYVAHPFAVAWLLDRYGFGEDVLIAALLHDAVEDTEATLDAIAEAFGPEVAAIVGHSSEQKLDEAGVRRRWIDRKRDHLAAIADAPVEARAVALADKLHNLISIQADLDAGVDVWRLFNAGRDDVLWYHLAMIEAAYAGEPALKDLAEAARAALSAVS
jgi:(p)ppGpp synthase/HD superfamily hydrolase